jgi:hypothetical protein
MNQVNRIAIGLCAFAVGAAAQDPVALDKMKAEVQAKLTEAMTTISVAGVMGKQVTGSPYSADEVRETTQVLADGTHIHNQNTTTVYRDGEGRIRRETPNNIEIFDPVAGVSYTLNPKTQTGRKMPVNLRVPSAAYTIKPDTMRQGQVGFAFSTSADGPQPVVLSDTIQAAKKTLDEQQAVAYKVGVAAGRLAQQKSGNREDLGQQVIEGVVSQGTRTTMTIDANTIGNDRPIQVINESWFSPDLQMTVMTKHTDPRTGEEVFRVTNIRRGEPGIGLFQPPAGYQITEPTQRSLTVSK